VIRAATAALVTIALVMTAWLFTGLPRPVATAMADAEFEPCLKQYNSALDTRDTQRVDGIVVKPRSRFTRAVTCGGLRLARDSG